MFETSLEKNIFLTFSQRFIRWTLENYSNLGGKGDRLQHI
jgi:hypothetical protein